MQESKAPLVATRKWAEKTADERINALREELLDARRQLATLTQAVVTLMVKVQSHRHVDGKVFVPAEALDNPPKVKQTGADHLV